MPVVFHTLSKFREYIVCYFPGVTQSWLLSITDTPTTMGGCAVANKKSNGSITARNRVKADNNTNTPYNASVTSNHGPRTILSPVRFLARKAEWSARGSFTSVLFPRSHQATGLVRLDTSAYLWFGWIIRRNQRVPRAMPVRAPHGNLQCFSYPTGPVRGPCVTRKGAVRRPYGHARELTQPRLAKIPHVRRIWPYGALTGPLRSPHGLFTGCLHDQNPYGTRKLIMHALKLRAPYGEAKLVRRRTGPVWAPWVDVRFWFKTAREQPVQGPGVWCHWGISKA